MIRITKVDELCNDEECSDEAELTQDGKDVLIMVQMAVVERQNNWLSGQRFLPVMANDRS